MSAETYAGVTQKEIDDGMVKVGIPSDDNASREWCWARRVSPTHARLANCCVFRDDVNFGDIVEFEEQPECEGGPHQFLKRFVRVVTRGSTQCEFMYSTDAEARDKSQAMREKLTHRLRTIRTTLDKLPESVRPICFEGLFTGYGCAAFPATVTAQQAEQFVAACPFVLDQHSEE
jgi:hypothetical protein